MTTILQHTYKPNETCGRRRGGEGWWGRKTAVRPFGEAILQTNKVSANGRLQRWPGAAPLGRRPAGQGATYLLALVRRRSGPIFAASTGKLQARK
jgi:hypothetical protein